MEDIPKKEELPKLRTYAESLLDKVKIDEMHGRYIIKSQYFQTTIDLLNYYHNNCLLFAQPFKPKIKIAEKSRNTANHAFINLFTMIKAQNEAYLKFSNELNNFLKNYKNIMDNSEKKIYNDYIKMENEYNNDKINSLKGKIKYNKEFGDLEKYLKENEEKKLKWYQI